MTAPLRITITGPQGSGKSTVARTITEALVGAGYDTTLTDDTCSRRWSGSGPVVDVRAESERVACPSEWIGTIRLVEERDRAAATPLVKDPDLATGLQFVEDFRAVLDSPVNGFRIVRPGHYRIHRDGDRVIFEGFEAGDPYPWDTDDQEAVAPAPMGFNTRAVDCGMSVRTTALIRNRFGGDCTLHRLAFLTDFSLRAIGFSEASITELREVIHQHGFTTSPANLVEPCWTPLVTLRADFDEEMDVNASRSVPMLERYRHRPKGSTGQVQSPWKPGRAPTGSQP